MMLSILTLLLLHTSVAEARTLFCTVAPFNNRVLSNAPSMMEDKDPSNKQFLVYETLRADCDDGYVIQLEGFGFGIYASEIEGIWISCPFVRDFHGTYVGPKINASIGAGGDVSMFVGPGVCFVGGIQINGYGVGFAMSYLKIMHRDDAPEAKTQKEEIPEERKLN